MLDATITIDPRDVDVAIFDMDGVLTDTARVHAMAWKQVFDACLKRRAETRGEAFRAFDIDADYRQYVDGKPRYDGVRCFLASRGIELEDGEPSDAAGRETVFGLGHRKNERFLELLRADGAARFDDAVELVLALIGAGIHTAVISASKNAQEVLERAGIHELFEARVDGVVAAEERLAGKPAPDVFLEAARRLNAEPERCIVVEDSLAGVEAGRRGGFGLVIGVARDGGRQRLEEAGADAVVGDLREVALPNSGEGPATA